MTASFLILSLYFSYIHRRKGLIIVANDATVQLMAKSKLKRLAMQLYWLCLIIGLNCGLNCWSELLVFISHDFHPIFGELCPQIPYLPLYKNFGFAGRKKMTI